MVQHVTNTKAHLCRCDHVGFNLLPFSYRHGLARSGSEYGPLTDLPDWSFAGLISFLFVFLHRFAVFNVSTLLVADGRPAPPLKGQLRRKEGREVLAVSLHAVIFIL